MIELFEMIGGVLGGGFGVAALNYGYKMWKEKQASEKSITATYEKVISIYQAMNSVLQETSIDRFLILKTTNGGGKPVVGRPIYASVIYEDYNSPFKTVKEKYQHLHVDKEYIQMLIESESKGVCKMVVDEMPEESLLKKIYKAEGVEYSEVYYIHQNSKEYWYCSVSTGKKLDHLPSKDALTVQLSLSKIRNIFRKVHS